MLSVYEPRSFHANLDFAISTGALHGNSFVLLPAFLGGPETLSNRVDHFSELVKVQSVEHKIASQIWEP